MHKKIGIIGGLSPESTVTYYLHITRSYVDKFGDYGYPDIIIYSVNLENYHYWRSRGEWNLIIDDLVKCANTLEAAGAEFALIATNTMHKVFDEVQKAVNIPLIHLIDETADQANELGLRKLGLLGTKYTMSDGFYQDVFAKKNLELIVPEEEDQKEVHRTIVEELVRGKLLDETKNKYKTIIKKLVDSGAEGIILGCTEIPLIVKSEDSTVPLLDTAVIHSNAALKYALKS